MRHLTRNYPRQDHGTQRNPIYKIFEITPEKTKPAVILQTGRFDNIDSTVIISNVSKAV